MFTSSRSLRLASVVGWLAVAACSGGDAEVGAPGEGGADGDEGGMDALVSEGGVDALVGGGDAGGGDAGGDGTVAPEGGTDAAADGGADAPDSDGMPFGPGVCTPTVKTKATSGPTRGSAIAITSDDARIIAVNRDVGSVSVIPISYDAGGLPVLAMPIELAVGGEPWQVVVNGCDDTAYVVLRKDQKVVEITDLKGTPTVGRSVAVGSEPTSLALTPHGHRLYVANWVDGTLSVIDPSSMTVAQTVDLNAAIASDLGPAVTPRPALAHPRAIAITNGGGDDPSDPSEKVYVTEWFAVRTGPESAVKTTADTNRKGLVYVVGVSTGAVSTLDLPPVADTGYPDAKGQTTGCFPNQVASVSLQGGFAYVSSTCASPVGPIGVVQKGVCPSDAFCAAAYGAGSTCSVAGALETICTNSCSTDADCSPIAQAGDCVIPGGSTKGSCKQTLLNAKTTTHPALTVIDLGTGAGKTTVLDRLFEDSGTARMPLLPTDMDFGAGFGYLSAEGADGVFRITISPTGALGGGQPAYINLGKSNGDTLRRLPIGVVVGKTHAMAFVANDGTREMTALDLAMSSIAGASANDFRIAQASALPAAGTRAEADLRGKRYFNTGLGRWSFKGEAYGACAACHVDGLSDGVTWYFDRGPRQTISLDGTFATGAQGDQRILDWTANLDEVPDYEANVRRVSGGIGALVTKVSNPLMVTDRINVQNEPPAQQGLEGSSTDIATSTSTSAHPHTVIPDWLDITGWIQNIRSPRKPTNLVVSDVAAGQTLFASSGCVGCHGGPKWTISKLFYKPDDAHNDRFTQSPHISPSLSLVSWPAVSLPPSFPASLYPSTLAGSQTMRSGTPFFPGFEQLQCVLRPVGTIGAPPAAGTPPAGVSDPAIGVLELREDMKTGAQGSGTQGTGASGDFTVGFNPPSLLGLQVGAPYFHAGNARSLEEAFGTTFKTHYQSLAGVFNPTPTEVKQLVAYLLSLDEGETTIAIPIAGSSGGSICFSP